ncbi:MAG: MFS transporter [Pseudomonadota bacterium]
MSSFIPLHHVGDARVRTLHYAWFAFFLTFVIWFGHAPLMAYIKAEFLLTDAQVKALLILNVALTIPARILIGMLVDRMGPRFAYTLILVLGGLFCIGFALAQTYGQLAVMRFLLGFVGAGFVVGIRLIAEWFPARQLGLAEGIYGGWGNFGSAAAALLLPLTAVGLASLGGWRAALVVAGLICIVYAFFFWRGVSNTPKGATYFKPKKSGGLEVSSRRDLVIYYLTVLPLWIALAVLVWKLSPLQLKLLNPFWTGVAALTVLALAVSQAIGMWKINAPRLREGVPAWQKYEFRQVSILSLAYLASFGSEIAVVSMLPLFFMDTFALSPVIAGFSAAGFVVANIVARPGGGWLSDRIGRRRALSFQLGGIAVGYLLMSQMANMPLALALFITFITSFFVQAACGGVYAVIPLIQRRMTGQIAGMAGAYGNVGGVVFLTVLSLVSVQAFFLVLAATAAVSLVATRFLAEPDGHMAEQLPDGSVQLIDVR